MSFDKIRGIFVVVLAGFLTVFQNPCIAGTFPEYNIVDLGTLGGGTSMAYGVNGQGTVAGKSETDDGYMKAFCWDPVSGMSEIGLGKALGLNEAGQVVGNIHHHTDDAFIWDAANGLSFLNKSDFLFATANGISDSGKVVGYARRFNDVDGTRAVLWDSSAGTITEIGTLGGPSYAYAINGTGEVVGNSGEPSRAFIWSDSHGIIDLGALNEEPWRYYGTDINDEGQVVGYLKTDEDTYRAFIWERETGMRLLSGTGESIALAVNRHGHVVGASGSIIGLAGKAYLWRDGRRVDLNQTIPVDSGWELREARDISDEGQICGNGLIHGEIHAFLLTPVFAVRAPYQSQRGRRFNYRLDQRHGCHHRRTGSVFEGRRERRLVGCFRNTLRASRPLVQLCVSDRMGAGHQFLPSGAPC